MQFATDFIINWDNKNNKFITLFLHVNCSLQIKTPNMMNQVITVKIGLMLILRFLNFTLIVHEQFLNWSIHTLCVILATLKTKEDDTFLASSNYATCSLLSYHILKNLISLYWIILIWGDLNAKCLKNSLVSFSFIAFIAEKTTQMYDVMYF